MNANALLDMGVALGFLLPTSTGLRKHILDAITPFRSLLLRWGVHDYDAQVQGPTGHVELPAVLVSSQGLYPTTASLYRPVSKRGDPRIWFTGLGKMAAAGEMLGIFHIRGQLYVINLARVDVPGALQSTSSPIAILIADFRHEQAKRIDTALEVLGAIQTSAGSGQNFIASAEERDAIEARAMGLAVKHFSRLRWTVTDVSAAMPYDLECLKGGTRIFVEVKGTSTLGTSVLLTRNEVNNARTKYPNAVLFVVSGIHLSIGSSGKVQASGGSVRVINPWKIDAALLDAIAYSYRLV